MNVNRSSGRGSDREQVEAFLNELSSVAIRLKQLSAGLEDSATAAAAPTARALLRLLEKFGPQTVPQLARNRATSRQNIQVIVNRLLVDGYVEMLENPAHQRSRLVCISSKGAKFLEASVDPWDRTLEQLATKLPGQAISDAAGLLSQLREVIGEGRRQRAMQTEIRRTKTVVVARVQNERVEPDNELPVTLL